MRNRLIDPILFLLAVSLLVPCPVPSAWIEIADAGRFSRESRDGLAESLQPGEPEGACSLTDVPSKHDHLCSQPGAIASSTIPNDAYFDKQWALAKVQALDPWEDSTVGQDILIAVLDTGIDQRHEDLADKVVASANFSDSPTASDRNGHGTHIAGIIAATADNGIGIAGIAPNCRLLNVKVAEDNGMVWPSTIAKGIVWAVDNGAKVINMSLTVSSPNQALEDALDYAWSNGVVVVAASGNSAGGKPVYPACYVNCIAVAATDASDSVVSWSSRADWIDVAAPGVSIYSTLPSDGYDYKNGTSMATAFVSAVVSLLFTTANDDNGNGFVNDEVRKTIEGSCDELGILSIR